MKVWSSSILFCCRQISTIQQVHITHLFQTCTADLVGSVYAERSSVLFRVRDDCACNAWPVFILFGLRNECWLPVWKVWDKDFFCKANDKWTGHEYLRFFCTRHHFCELSPLEPNSNFLNEKDAEKVGLGRLLSLWNVTMWVFANKSTVFTRISAALGQKS